MRGTHRQTHISTWFSIYPSICVYTEYYIDCGISTTTKPSITSYVVVVVCARALVLQIPLLARSPLLTLTSHGRSVLCARARNVFKLRYSDCLRSRHHLIRSTRRVYNNNNNDERNERRSESSYSFSHLIAYYLPKIFRMFGTAPSPAAAAAR